VETEYNDFQIIFNLYSIKLKTRYLMFNLINFIVLVQICANFGFDGCDMFQKSWDRGNKRLGKLLNSQRTPVWNIPQANRLIRNRYMS